jgi:ATP-dependent Clp protease ATP-binding subunit ClpC
VFERFTERAGQVVVLAQDEARALRHNYIGTEHLLLGLLREEQGLAARVLESFDVTVEEVRAQVARIVGQGYEPATQMIPFTPRAKKILELAGQQATQMRHPYVETEHVLLGLLREGGGVATRILEDFAVSLDTIWEAIFRELGADAPDRAPLSDPLQVSASRPLGPPVPPRDIHRPRWLWLYEPVAALAVAAAVFAAGLAVGWLIWG